MKYACSAEEGRERGAQKEKGGTVSRTASRGAREDEKKPPFSSDRRFRKENPLIMQRSHKALKTSVLFEKKKHYAGGKKRKRREPSRRRSRFRWSAAEKERHRASSSG